MDKAVKGSRLRSVVLGAALGAACGMAQANPTGPTVVNGQVRFSGGAGVLDIHNSPSAIINWQGFSIQQGEITRFLQQNANSAVLNRVIGQNPSDILGSLLSNGRVFVVNPNGILFGRNAVVDTQGLIASTLNINNADFLAGKYEFAAAAGAGAIRNQGFIRSGPGGEVVLIAPSIENSGIIQADDGDLVLAAGRKVTLTSLDAAGVSFDVQAPEDSVLNLGQLIARRGTIGAFAGTLRNTGRMEAGGLATDAAGNIVLMAKADLALESESVVDASGGDGGAIRIESESGSATVDGVVEARGITDRGGQVDITGDEVVLRAAVDASGERGGGRVRVGGGYRGEGELRTTARTEMTEQASIDVSARGEGDGGLAVVWADGTAEVQGSGNIAARGGARGGDGGTIETSGKQQLSVGGAPDASAAAGDGGLWLLDPLDVVIASGGGGTIDADTLVLALQGGMDVTITTTGPGPDDGDITVASGLNAIDMTTQQATLNLDADNDVIVAPGSGGISAFNGDLALWMNAGAGSNIDIQDDVAPSGAGGLQLNAPGGFIYIRNGATVSVDAANATSQGRVVVGFQGVGTLDIKNGAGWVHSDTLSAGAGTGGSGNINITGGAELELPVGAHLVAGLDDPGVSANIQVDGAGSLLKVDGDIYMGGAGETTLTISNGGTVTASNAFFGVTDAEFGSLSPAGTAIGGTGILDMHHNTASLVTTLDLGTEDAQGGVLSIGHSAGTFGSAVIDGNLTKVVTRGLDNAVQAGQRGSTVTPGLAPDDLVIRNGALVHTLQLTAGDQGVGRISIEDTDNNEVIGTEVKVDTEFVRTIPQPGDKAGFVGVSRVAGSQGIIDLSGGAKLLVTHANGESGPGIQLGSDPGADGSMTLDGVGTLVEIIQTSAPLLGGPFMEAGRDGAGSLTLSDRARLVMQGPEAGIDVGQGNGGMGNLIVEGGAELQINVGDPFNLQESYFNIARDTGSQGNVVIRDLNSLVKIEGTNAADGSGVVVNVGRGGDGSLSVSNTAVMQISAPDAAPFPGMNIGGSISSVGNGSVSVDDADLEITGNTPQLTVGRNGTGDLSISNDGRVGDPTFVTVGWDPLSAGTISMSSGGFLRLRDTASAQAAAIEPAVSEGDGAALVVGREGVGVLDMQNGSAVVIDGTPILGGPILTLAQGAGLFVGRLAGGDGSVSIADSSLTVIGSMQQAVIGDQGTALLELLGGGSVTLSGSVTVGAQAGSDGVLSFLAGGQLDAPDVINGGTVQGTGVITGNLLAAPGLPNTVAPGASAGKLRVDGDFTANSQTVLSIELGGTNDLVPQYDILDVGGVATLEGQIEVSLIDDFTPGYAPSIGDLFTIVRAGTAVQDQGVTLVLVPPASGLVPLFSSLDLTLEAVVASPTGLWTGAGDGTTWGDPLNWEGDILPGSGDDVLFPELAGQTVIDFNVVDTFILSLSMVGDDILEVNGGLLFISDTALADTVVVNGGSLVASLDVSTLQLNGGTLEQGPLPIAAGEFEWNGGDVQGETGIVAEVFKLDTSGSRSLDGAITVNSSGVWGSGSGRVTVNGAGVSRPTITASAAAAVDIVGNLTLAALDVNNDGLLDKVGGGGVSNFSTLNNAGTLRLGAGTTNADSFLQAAAGSVLSLEGGDIASASALDIRNGIVQGSGDIDADLSMSGPSVLSPGLSIGDLSISGALALSASSRVVIDVDGISPGAFDTVTAGTVDLTGGPTLEVAGIFVPAGAETVTPILCTASPSCLTGTFGAVDLVSGTIPAVTEIYQPDSMDLLLTSAVTSLWIGGEDLLWSTPDNWSQGAVPDSGSQVEISSALGPITINGAGLAVDTLNSSIELILAGGDFSVFGDALIDADFRLVAGILDGPGDVTISGGLTLQNTILRGSGNLELATGGVLSQSGITTVDGRTLINRSSDPANRVSGGVQFLNGGRFINVGRLLMDSATLDQGAGAAGSLSNRGNLGMNDASVKVAIDNTGTVTVGGDLQLTAAVLSNLSGGTLNLQGDSRVGGSGSITNQGALFKLGGGTTHVEVPVTTSTGLNVTTGTLSLRRDSLLGGNLNTGSDALLAITGGSHQLADGTAFGGAGTVRLNDTQLRVNGDLSNAADLRIAGSTIEATGALDNTGSVRLGDGVVLNMSSFSNRAGAELLKVGGAGESILGMPLNSAGDVGVESGTLTLAALNQGGGDTRVASGATLAVDDGLMLQGGTLGGDGLIDGNVFNGGGVLSAGASPGTLFIDGNYVQGSDGELLVELAGRAPGEYDVLSVSGTASLDGTLSVRFDLPVFPGVIGDRFQILFATALELNGGPLGFANLDAQDGYEFDPDQAVLSNGFQLVVSGVPLGGPMAPSPGPSPDELPLDELLAQALGEEAINQVLATSDADGVDEEDALLAQLDEGDDGAGEVAVGICQ